MTSDLEIAIGRFAKRQQTWFRGMERRGVPIRWIGPEDSEAILTAIGNRR
jgi:tRNA dimethylallyltransferase